MVSVLEMPLPSGSSLPNNKMLVTPGRVSKVGTAVGMAVAGMTPSELSKSAMGLANWGAGVGVRVGTGVGEGMTVRVGGRVGVRLGPPGVSVRVGTGVKVRMGTGVKVSPGRVTVGLVCWAMAVAIKVGNVPAGFAWLQLLRAHNNKVIPMTVNRDCWRVNLEIILNEWVIVITFHQRGIDSVKRGHSQ